MNQIEKALVTNEKNVENSIPSEDSIQPFKEMPSVSSRGREKEKPITAHDLFSFYTANVIKEDIIYAR
jgi:hypothetical protein